MPVTNEGIERELARQELSRRELAAFCWYTFRQYRIARVHRLLADKLMQVERYVATGGREGIGRLMLFCPPRVGKSEITSVRFPAWFLGRNPDCGVILASCTADLAIKFSRQVRDIVNDDPFQTLWGKYSTLPRDRWVSLSESSHSAEAWELAGRRGELKAAGVGGSIVGRGAHLAILDDPIKNRAEAESKRARDELDSWYKSAFYSRLEPGGAIVVMHQRWGSDDLAGRLLRRMVEEEGADQWEVVSLPALAEEWAPDEVGAEEHARALKDGWWKAPDALGRRPGEALWPGKYSAGVLGSIRANVGGYEWDSLYQQRPQRVEGTQIRARDIIQVRPEDLPGGITWARGWDLAVSGRERADYISGALVGRSSEGKLYIRHVTRLKGPWADARPTMVERMAADGAGATQAIETAGQQAGYFQELQRDPKLAGVPIVGVNPREVGSKEVRAQVWASRIQDGLVHLVRDGTWDVEGFIAEAIMFPNGAHDDQVDAVSLAVQALGSGSGWALYAKRQVEKWRAEGRQVDEVPRPWLDKVVEGV